MSLNRDQILAADDLKIEHFPVPEWGGDIYLRVMNGEERDAYESWAVKVEKSTAGVRAFIASLCIVDEQGKRLFSEDDIKDLNRKSAAVLERILSAALKLNAVTAQDVEDIAKN